MEVMKVIVVDEERVIKKINGGNEDEGGRGS